MKMVRRRCSKDYFACERGRLLEPTEVVRESRQLYKLELGVQFTIPLRLMPHVKLPAAPFEEECGL
jgi:hypothetical protein